MPEGSPPQAKELLDWLAAQQPAMLGLLEKLVNTDSGTYDKAGVDAVGTHIRDFLAGHRIDCETRPQDRFGDAIVATIGASRNSTILLMGHRDTVFPKGEAGRRPFHIADG